MSTWGRAHIPGFLGVCARTEFPRYMPPGSSIIINLDPHFAHGGTHWCACHASRDGRALYYVDPFGLSPPSQVTRNAWKNGLEVYRSDVQHQRFGENNCGPRSLAYLQEMALSPDDTAAFMRICREAVGHALPARRR